MNHVRLGILGSGKGSNFAAILEAIASGKLDADVAIVISDVADAGILTLARDAGIPTATVIERSYRTRLSEETERDLVELLHEAEVNLVVLAGYMRVVKSPLLEAYPGRIVNIHPSLLPSFRGLAAWEQALAAGAPESGCTVHLVDAGVDTGEILAQSRVPVLPGDTAASLHARIQVAEHALYPAVLQRLITDLADPAS